MSKRILVIGAAGQIGSELTMTLRKRYGDNQVVASDLAAPNPNLRNAGPFEFIDVTQRDTLDQAITKHDIGIIYHMAAILSAVGEAKPDLCWNVNINGLYNVLQAGHTHGLRLFCPSSIAAFGPETPCTNTPQETILRPRTMYGVTKVAGELLCDYYFDRFGVDVRGIRYPGIISYVTPPGGGTTDYAVEIFYRAVQEQCYECFVQADTVLPMMYMPDCIKATVDLMDADLSSLIHHAGFNLAAMSFSVAELAEAIRQHIPQFTITYKPDPVKQAIANSWPKTIDDSAARQEWGWQPSYDLEAMTADMIEKLTERHRAGQL